MNLRHVFAALVLVLLISAPTFAADPSIKTAKVEIPKEVTNPIRPLLDETAIQFRDDKGVLVADIWFRKDLPTTLAEDKVKKGVKLEQLPSSMLFGVIRLHQKWNDYRKQATKPGVYTMRLAFQPVDGDHVGTAPVGSFILFAPIKRDKGETKLDEDILVERSVRASSTEHPSIWVVLPGSDVKDSPKLSKWEQTNWVVYINRDVTIKGKKAGTIGFGLILIGFSSVA